MITGEQRYKNFDQLVGRPDQQIFGDGIASLYNFTPELIYEGADTFDTFQEDNEDQTGILDLLKNYLLDDQYKNQRTAAATLLGGPVAGALSYFGGGILDAIKNFNDRRRGRLDITSDAGIMPTGREIGAATTADYYGGSGDDGGRSDSAQSFSESQSYGGGGTMGDLGADTFF